jgi:hypothetical protein
MKSNGRREEASSALRPVGVALAAVVAGLGAAKAERAAEARSHAPLEPASQANTYFIDPTNHPGFEEDASLVVGESEPVAVLGGAARPARQSDLFEL